MRSPARLPGLVLVVGLGIRLCCAQAPPLHAQLPDRYVMERDAMLAFERALLNDEVDSVLYWVDRDLILERKRRTDTIPLFSDQLRTLALFYTGQFPRVLADIARERHYYYYTYPPPVYKGGPVPVTTPRMRPSWQMGIGVYDLWTLRADRVLQVIKTRVADGDAREFLSLYWMAMLNDLYMYEARQPFSSAEIVQRATDLLARVPDHPQAALLRRWTGVLVPSAVGMGWDFRVGNDQLNGGLEKRFDQAHNFAINLYVTYKHWMFLSTFREHGSRLSADLSHADSVWRQGEHVGNLMVGLHLGHMVLDRPAFRLIPTAGVQLGGLGYYEQRDDKRTTSRGNWSVQPTFELNMDLKLNFKARAQAPRRIAGEPERWSPKLHGFYLVRGTLGYLPMGYGPAIVPQGSIWYFSIGFGSFMQTARYE